MEKVRILWVDDEIDLLKPHILFLEQKGYNVDISNNGAEGLELVKSNEYDIVFDCTTDNDLMYVLNLLETDRRIRIAGKFLASFEPERIMVCSVRRYGRNPVKKFCEITGAKAFAERFIPGTLTNPLIDQFHEADVLLMIDPHADKQALAEAKLARIPVVSFIDTDDYLYDIDLAIPANNRGRKSLSRMLWLLARQIMRERGKIPPDGDIDLTLNDFESKISKPEVESS